ncbi:TPA: thiamine phosphate synthase [bacterium]|nr:thiamine phosphate synthase [bacterium]
MSIRIIDANLNRTREGLRVVEDIARFILEDREITKKIKGIRHRIADLSPKKTILFRDIEGDIGRKIEDYKKKDWKEILKANIKRTEEALRVLEEFLGEEFRKIRYEVYGIEKGLFKPKIKGLYLIIDPGLCEPISLAKEAVEAGVKIIQLRDKRGDIREFLRLAEGIMKLSDEICLIINDRLDVALTVGADGLHIGQDDIPISYAKRVFPGIIGVSTHSLDEAIKAEEEGADYIGLGPIFPTETKPGLYPIGPEIIKEVKEKINIPVVAIGGITLENIEEVKYADSIAVLSAILESKNIKETCFRFIENLRFLQKIDF